MSNSLSNSKIMAKNIYKLRVWIIQDMKGIKGKV